MFALPFFVAGLLLAPTPSDRPVGSVIISTKMTTISGTVRLEGGKLYLVGTKRVLLTVIDPAISASLAASRGKKRTVAGTPDLVSGTGAFLVTGLR